MTIAAPSGGGKTTFVQRLLRYSGHLIEPPPQDILFCYTEYQPNYDELVKIPNVKMVEGIPDLETLRENISIRKLVIFDDMMLELSHKKDLMNKVFTRVSSHCNCSCILLTQNLFYENSRTSRINCHYLVLMKNPADQTAVQTLGRQVFPTQFRFFREVYKEALRQPYSYLLLDLTPSGDDNLRLRTNIFYPDEFTVVYQPK